MMIIKVLCYPFKILSMLLIYFYKFCISPILPHTCRYTPTCSTYMLVAIKKYGFFIGVFMGIKRICRCNPWAKGGFDPVPLNIKGDMKWLI